MGAETTRKSVGTTGVPHSGRMIDVGYVTLPSRVGDRTAYVKQCLQNGVVSVKTEAGAFYREALISQAELSQVVFPVEEGGTGSVVVFVIVPKHNQPVVISVLNLGDVAGALSEEGQFKITESTLENGNGVSIEGRTKNSTELNLGSTGVNSKIKLKATSSDDSSSIELQVSGELNTFSKTNTRLASVGDVELANVDQANESQALVRYQTQAKKWNIFGDADSQGQAALLGDDLVGFLEDFCSKVADFATEVAKLTVTSSAPGSPSSPPINLANFINISTQLSLIKEKFKQALSQRVLID